MAAAKSTRTSSSTRSRSTTTKRSTPTKSTGTKNRSTANSGTGSVKKSGASSPTDRYTPSKEAKAGNTEQNSSRVSSLISAFHEDGMESADHGSSSAAAQSNPSSSPTEPYTKADGTKVTPLSGGGTQTSKSQKLGSATTTTSETFRPDGTKANRTWEYSRPAQSDEKVRDVNGTSLFGSMGHDNGQMLVNDLHPRSTGRRGRGGPKKPDPVNQSVGRIQSTTYDESGKPSGTRTTDTHSWEKRDGSEKVTRFQTEGEADRWELEKNNKDGSWERQRFVEGTDDTWVDRKFEKDGWEVSTHEAQTADLASQNRPKGAGQATVPDQSKIEVATKEGGSVADIKAKLGKDFDRLMKESPEFKKAMESLGDQELDLTSATSSATYTDREKYRYNQGRRTGIRGVERKEFEESLGFSAADGASGILSRAGENGAWSFGFEDGDGNRSASLAGVDENGDSFRYGTEGAGSGNPVKSASQAVDGGKMIASARRSAAVAGLRQISRNAPEAVPLKQAAKDYKSAASRLAKVGKYLGPAGDAVASFFDTKNAISQFSQGNMGAGLYSSVNAAGSAGVATYGASGALNTSSRLAQRIAMGGKALGGLGAGVQIVGGLHSVANGDNGGFFDMASGAGTAAALLGAGPVGWGLAVGGAVGGAVYRHLDETGIAETQI